MAMRTRRATLSVAVAGLMISGMSNARAQVAAPPSRGLQIEWEHEIRADDADYDLQGVAAGGGGDGVWVLVGSRPKGRLSVPAAYLLTHLDNSGAPTLRFDVATAVKIAEGGYSYVPIAAIGANRVALVARSGNRTVLAVFDGKSGQQVRESTIQPAGDLLVTKAITIADGALLLLGRIGAEGWFARVDEFGRTAWEKRLGAEEIPVVLDGGPTADGGFVLLGSAVPTAADPITWVGKVNAQGGVVAQARLHVYAESLGVGADGSSLLVGGRQGADGKDEWTRVLTASLEETGSPSTIVSALRFPYEFKSAQARGGWVVVGGTRDHLPWLGLVTSTGQLAWSDTRRYDPKLIPIAGRSDVVFDRESGFAVFDLALLDAQAAQRNTIRVVKFKAP